MTAIQQLGSLSQAKLVLEQAQKHILKPAVYLVNQGLFGNIYGDELVIYADDECFKSASASEAIANNDVVWVGELKKALGIV